MNASMRAGRTRARLCFTLTPEVWSFLRRVILFSAVLAAALFLCLATADALPETSISYSIDVKVDPAKRMLRGHERLQWVNPSDVDVSSVPLHLYLNAFSNTETTWMREGGLFLGVDRLLRDFPDPWGFCKLVSIVQVTPDGPKKLNGSPIQPDDGNAVDRTLMEVVLARAVRAGETLELRIDFEARLPAPMSRTGGYEGFLLVAQWFPKIGVMEPVGVRHATTARWAARQFHAATEFYSDFADYDVTIKVPKGYVVGATGRRFPASDPTTVHFTQKAVHDFAFVAGRDLVELSDSYSISNTRKVEVHFLVPRSAAGQVARLRPVLYKAMQNLAKRIAPYPYDTLTIVLPPVRAIDVSGMEYPTFITGFPGDRAWDMGLCKSITYPELVLIHEFVHQYFYAILASNEQEEAFLDEGMTSYWEQEIMEEIYGRGRANARFLGIPFRWWDVAGQDVERSAKKIREPIRKSPSSLYFPRTWGAQVYDRTALTMETACRLFGRDAMDRVFAAYYDSFAFRHPDVEDFLAVAARIGGTQLEQFLREALAAERVPDFEMKHAESNFRESVLGFVPVNGKILKITEENREEQTTAGLDTAALEKDGRVLMQITDPGWFRDGKLAAGSVIRNFCRPGVRRTAVKFEAQPDEFYETSVLIKGPGWRFLPVDLEFVFADGVVVRDRWDGKSPWRRYTFVRKAPLLTAAIDPERKILVDVKPQNNSLSVKPDQGFATGWGLRLGMFAQWLSVVVSSWI